MTAVLRPCEATTVAAGVRRWITVRCAEPGQWWEAPDGNRHVLCGHHAEVFAVVAELIEFEREESGS